MKRLHQILKDLEEITVRPGRYARLQQKINDIQDAIRALARGDNIVAGKHIEKRQLNPHTISITGTPGGGISASSDNHPFKPYQTNGLKFRLIPGTVGNRIAGNWNTEFTATANADGKWCYLAVNINDSGNVLSVTLVANANSIPTADLATSDGNLPGTLYQPLFAYDSGADSISRFYVAQEKNLAVEITNAGGFGSAIYRTVALVDSFY